MLIKGTRGLEISLSLIMLNPQVVPPSVTGNLFAVKNVISL